MGRGECQCRHPGIGPCSISGVLGMSKLPASSSIAMPTAWSPWRAGGSASVEERQILELRMQGFGSAEIAKKLGTYERKVFRLLERIRSLAKREELAL